MNPTTRDRAIGAVLGSAAGDALGAGYEFRPAVPEPTPIRMAGGGSFGWAPGEWTDDTSMAVPILRTLARGGDLASEPALDGLVAARADWARTAPDVGIQTRNVLTGLEARVASAARAAARQEHEYKGRSAGNGSLMRTAPLVLGYLTGAVDESSGWPRPLERSVTSRTTSPTRVTLACSGAWRSGRRSSRASSTSWQASTCSTSTSVAPGSTGS